MSWDQDAFAVLNERRLKLLQKLRLYPLLDDEREEMSKLTKLVDEWVNLNYPRPRIDMAAVIKAIKES